MSALRFCSTGHAIGVGQKPCKVCIQELILVILTVGAGGPGGKLSMSSRRCKKIPSDYLGNALCGKMTKRLTLTVGNRISEDHVNAFACLVVKRPEVVDSIQGANATKPSAHP
jgi:hypothetical protein